MNYKNAAILLRENDSPILQNSTPAKMLIACVLSCIVGIVLMALLSQYLLMSVFICIIVCMFITTPLYAAGRISINAACLAPMILLCFVYTPLSWFTYDGLLGCTPYLSILFITMIALTYYRRIQTIMLSLYGFVMLGLTIHWLATWPGPRDTEGIVNILVAYLLTATVTVGIIEGIKLRNKEINKRITELSLHDDLTGLLNRRAIEKIFGRLEGAFKKEGHEYAIVMLDIDRFKSINDCYGHNLGDAILKSIATSILENIRSEDYAFRFGGDEFLLILPDVNCDTADQICARLEEGLREMQGYAFPLTVSKGYALCSESVGTIEALDLADRRMYEAKRSQNTEENATGESLTR